ncbi:MAG: glutamine--fructose-6-phosphate transaminase (isomerizing), partial [Candidatus Odinarchaeota archaeon]
DLTDVPGRIGIGHTRWATHGVPSKKNSHPHVDCGGKIAVVHNGIIENYTELKDRLSHKGHIFRSETDTEVIPHLIEEHLNRGLPVFTAILETVKELKGSYAIAVLVSEHPDKIYVARNESPLVIGVKDKSYVFCASDIPAFLPVTNRVMFLYDGEVAELSLNDIVIKNLDGSRVQREIVDMDLTPEMAKKGGFPHFMLKEIFEQPKALKNTLRVDEKRIIELCKLINDSGYVIFTSAGTSFYAGLCGKYLLANLSRTRAEAVISSEFEDTMKDVIDEETTVVAISQSGETSDTISAAKYAKRLGAKIIAISNTVGSSLTRLADSTLYTQAGPEIGVAATKTFLVQLGALSIISAKLAELKRVIDRDEYRTRLNELNTIPEIIQAILNKTEGEVKSSTEVYYNASSFLYLGRGVNSAVAMEGALKLKEISYIHAEGYAAGESKHGPIALISQDFPVVFVAPMDSTHSKIIGNIMEMKSRGAKIISVIEEDDDEIKRLSDTVFHIPKTSDNFFKPMVYIVPLQLFAYYMAVRKGFDPDKPRNLAKAVTVA